MWLWLKSRWKRRKRRGTLRDSETQFQTLTPEVKARRRRIGMDLSTLLLSGGATHLKM